MDITEWLLEPDTDPAIRWQAMQDLTDASADEVAAVRATVATEGWGAHLLALQGDDGQWDGGTYRPGWVDDAKPFFDAWTSTHFSLHSLREYGLDPQSDQARRALALVRENVRWEDNGEPYFDGEVEPCINGVALASAAYFGQDCDLLLERLLAVRLGDGGWNCWADNDSAAVSSFHSTMCALDGLWAYERAGATAAAARSARLEAEEYLLARSLFRRRSTGGIADPRFLMPSGQAWWFYDILRGLDYLRLARPERDPRCAEAVELLRAAQQPQGYWLLENTHSGPTHFDLGEHEGFPSKWVTLRALRVMKWWDEG